MTPRRHAMWLLAKFAPELKAPRLPRWSLDFDASIIVSQSWPSSITENGVSLQSCGANFHAACRQGILTRSEDEIFVENGVVRCGCGHVEHSAGGGTEQDSQTSQGRAEDRGWKRCGHGHAVTKEIRRRGQGGA